MTLIKDFWLKISLKSFKTKKWPILVCIKMLRIIKYIRIAEIRTHTFVLCPFQYFRYRNRFQIPTDLLYYRYNAGRVPSRGTSTGINSVFDPIDPSTPDIFDYDYDVNVNYDRPNGTPTPQLGVLPEQAVALANTKSRKARLWRKVYYLQYLRELYRK